eukprot:SAG31_NODE_22550_length_523_cov_0.728774_1_plen_113_part_10
MAMAAVAKPTALVTGASGVFGRHICAGLVKAGWSVVAVVRDKQKGEALVQSAGGADSDCSFLLADLDRRDSIKALADEWGAARPLHALVNNAAITPTQREEGPDGVELQWSVN